jgi:hypothetical protein
MLLKKLGLVFLSTEKPGVCFGKRINWSEGGMRGLGYEVWRLEKPWMVGLRRP